MDNGNRVVVSLDDIRRVFGDLLSSRKSREGIAKWASAILTKNDRNELILFPVIDRQRIWKAIVYLTGVDLMDSPSSYFHINSDFENYLKTHLE